MEGNSLDFRNEVLDEIISSRRSIRAFTDEIPAREFPAIGKPAAVPPAKPRPTVAEATFWS